MIKWSLSDEIIGYSGAGTRYGNLSIDVIDDTPVARIIAGTVEFSHSHKYFAQQTLSDGVFNVVFWIDCAVSAGGQEQKVNVKLTHANSGGVQQGSLLINADVVVDANAIKKYTVSSASKTAFLFTRADLLVLEFTDAVGDAQKKLRYLGTNANEADSRIETQNIAATRRIT